MTPDRQRAIAQRQSTLSSTAWAHVQVAAALAPPAPGRRPERTRYGLILRVEAAAASVPAARAELAAAQRLWWALALTADAVAIAAARAHCGPAPYDECLQEARWGLYRAAQRFEPDRKIKFATYARWWARAAVTRSIAEGGRPIALSSSATNTLQEYRRLMREQPELTTAEAAAVMGVRRTQLEAVLGSLSVVSVERPVPGTDGQKRIEDLLEAPAVDLDDAIDEANNAARLRAALPSLPERLRRLLELRLEEDRAPGSPDGWARNLVQVGEALGLSRERARQLQREAEVLLREIVQAPSGAVAAK